MRGFGNFKDIDKLKAFTEAIEKEDIIEIELTEDQKAKLENVVVPLMDNGTYSKEDKPKKAITESSGAVKKEPEIGAAGNKEETEEEKEKEPIMGGIGGLSMKMKISTGKLGGQSIAPELEKKGLEESFDDAVTTDEDPVKEAKDRTKQNTMVGKMKEKSIKTAKDMMGAIDEIRGKQYDFDSTKESGTIISNKPINAKNPEKSVIPKGW